MARPKLDRRLLAWERDEANVYAARTAKLFAIVFRWRYGPGYHWEIFYEGEVNYYGQARSLHSALSHVEGNCVGRGMLEDVPVQETEELRSKHGGRIGPAYGSRSSRSNAGGSRIWRRRGST
jgi:hypothetical protein